MLRALLVALLVLRGRCDAGVRTPTQEMLAEVDKPIPVTRVEGVLGRKAMLPCDISTRHPDDEVYMVLWFKENEGEPLYSFDLRGRKPGPAKLWSSAGSAERRAHLRASASPAQLVVSELTQADDGTYRCRVDYRDSPTRNSRIALSVIVPPEKPVIYDSKRRDRSKVHELLSEGSDVGFICEVTGGRPRPRVTWLLDGRLLDASYEHRRGGVTVNHVTLARVGREHLGARLACQASNTDLAPPAATVTVLDLNLKPLTVQILGKERQLSADNRYEVECRTSGSRPHALISWWKGSRQIKRIIKKLPDEGGYEISVLTLTPGYEDDGKYLTCRSENPAIPDSALEDKWRLAVHYKPIVSLKLGSTINPHGIKEGDGVFFQCSIRANPKIYKISWFHEDEELHHNVSAGAIVSDQSLVLQGVSKASAGRYSCSADNAEGRGVSEAVVLRVMYAPVCRDARPQTLAVSEAGTPLELRCAVDAQPPALHYLWTLPGNASADDAGGGGGGGGAQQGSPLLRYDAAVHGHGPVTCRASNAAGRQAQPCVFQVVAAERPPPPSNCSVWNRTADSLLVGCSADEGGVGGGVGGGVPGERRRHYLLELVELPGMTALENVTWDAGGGGGGAPVFQLRGLRPGVSYSARVYAVGERGRSRPFVVEPVGYKHVAKYVDSGAPAPLLPAQAVLMAAAALLPTLVAAALLAVCLARRRRRRRLARRPPAGKQDAAAAAASDGLKVADPAVSIALMDRLDGPEPDVVPSKNRRYPLKNLARMCRTPAQRRIKRKQTQHEAAGSREERQNHVNNARNILNGVCGGRGCAGVSAPASPVTLSDHPAVATVDSIQESCI